MNNLAIRVLLAFLTLASLTDRAGAGSGITVALLPVADAEVTASAPASNFGATVVVRVRNEGFVPSSTSYVYLRFDLSGIPPDAWIDEATLQMTAFQGFAFGGDGNVYIHFVAQDGWSENVIDWNSRPSHGAALGSWWIWYGFGDPHDQVGSTSSPELLTAVREAVAGDSSLSLMLRSPGYDTEYRSREYLDPAQRPRLTVRYVPKSQTPAGRVPDRGAQPLRLSLHPEDPSRIDLSWGPSCGFLTDDYAVYEGSIGSWYDHIWKLCSTGGARTASITAGDGNHYYLVVPLTPTREGSYGVDSEGVEIPAADDACRITQDVSACP